MSETLAAAQAIATARYYDRADVESYDDSVLATAREIETYAGYAHLGMAIALKLQLLRPRYMRYRLLDVLYESEGDVVRDAFCHHPSARDARALLELGFLRVIFRVITLVMACDTYSSEELRRMQGDIARAQQEYVHRVDRLEDPPGHQVCAPSPLQASRSMPDLIAFAAQSGAQGQLLAASGGGGGMNPRPRRLSPANAHNPFLAVLYRDAVDQLAGLAAFERRRLADAIERAQRNARPRSTQRTRSAEAPSLLPLVVAHPAYALVAFVADTWAALEKARSSPRCFFPTTAAPEVSCLARQFLALRTLCRAAYMLIDHRLDDDASAYLPPLMHMQSALLAEARASLATVLAAAPVDLGAQCHDAALELCMLDVLTARAVNAARKYARAYREMHVHGNPCALDKLRRELPERAHWVVELDPEDGDRRFSDLTDVLELVQRIVHGALAQFHQYAHLKKAPPAHLQWQRTASPACLILPVRGQRSRQVSMGHMRRPSAPVLVPGQKMRARRHTQKLESPPKICIPVKSDA